MKNTYAAHAQAVFAIVRTVTDIDEVNEDTQITTMNMDSIRFIRMVVALENAFDIEFDSHKLEYMAFYNVRELVEYTWQLKEKSEQPAWKE